MQRKLVENSICIQPPRLTVNEGDWAYTRENCFSENFQMCRAVIIRGEKASFFQHYATNDHIKAALAGRDLTGYVYLTSLINMTFPIPPDNEAILSQCGANSYALLLRGKLSHLGSDPTYFTNLACPKEILEIPYEVFSVSYNHQLGEVLLTGYQAQEKLLFPNTVCQITTSEKIAADELPKLEQTTNQILLTNLNFFAEKNNQNSKLPLVPEIKRENPSKPSANF